MLRLQLWVFVFGLAGLAGCEAPKKVDKVNVTTKVTFANGQPVRDVMCCFIPHTAYQMPGEFPLDATGNVTKTANGAEPILHPGKYTVYFQPINARTAADQAKFAAAFKLVPAKYTQAGGTGLDVDVGSSGGAVTIQLES